MRVIELLYLFISRAVVAVMVAAIVLILLRSLFNYLQANPFTWSAINLRRATEPLLARVRAVLIGFRLDPKVAPFIAVILLVVAGLMAIQVVRSVLNTIAGIVFAVSAQRPGAPVAIIGYLIFGLLGLYVLGIFIRIILLWMGASYANRFLRFLYHATEPLLGPLRRKIPPVSMFDISPIVAFIIIWVCQQVVAATLLRGWPVEFF